MIHRHGSALVVIAVLTACSTPNIDDFAAQSGRLSSAVAIESSETSRHFDLVAWQAGQHLDAETAEEIAGLAGEYASNARLVDDLLEEAARYAEALASLAAAGETGGEAVESLADSVSRFGSVTGILAPGADLASDAVLKVARAVGKAWTRIEAQNDLREVVATMSGEDGAVAVLARGIADIYGSGGPQPRLVEEIYDLERVLIRRGAGEQMVGLYEQLAAESLEAMYADTRLTCFFMEENALNRDCMTDGRFESLAAVHEIMDSLEPRYLRYSRELADLQTWRGRRLSNAAAIVRAVAAWKQEHDEIAVALETCSGWRPLTGACGPLGSDSLKAAVDTLKSLVEED